MSNPLDDIDETLHAKSRLGIMTIVTSVGEAEFSRLKSELGMTDGNLGAHIRVLEQAGYVEVSKTFHARKPRTTVKPTRAGRRAFRVYLDRLESVIKMARD